MFYGVTAHLGCCGWGQLHPAERGSARSWPYPLYFFHVAAELKQGDPKGYLCERMGNVVCIFKVGFSAARSCCWHQVGFPSRNWKTRHRVVHQTTPRKDGVGTQRYAPILTLIYYYGLELLTLFKIPSFSRSICFWFSFLWWHSLHSYPRAVFLIQLTIFGITLNCSWNGRLMSVFLAIFHYFSFPVVEY